MSAIASRARSRFEIRPFTPRDRIPYFALLAEARLPTAGLDDHLRHAVIAGTARGVIGGATVELYESGGLLRSVVVAPSWQRRGVGQALTDAILDLARRSTVPAVYLLTRTAERFFAARGFTAMGREEIPDAMTASAELRGACPASAVVMRLGL